VSSFNALCRRHRFTPSLPSGFKSLHITEVKMTELFASDNFLLMIAANLSPKKEMYGKKKLDYSATFCRTQGETKRRTEERKRVQWRLPWPRTNCPRQWWWRVDKGWLAFHAATTTATTLLFTDRRVALTLGKERKSGNAWYFKRYVYVHRVT